MRAPWLWLAVGLTGCIKDDPCTAEPVAVYDTRVLDATSGQMWMSTPAAEKDCHATFIASLEYTGDDALDPALPRPEVDVSASAIGTGGEQPGLLGILTEWTAGEDPETGSLFWTAEMDAGAKNVDAPAVNYQLAAVVQPGVTLPVQVQLEIDYRPPASDSGEAARVAPWAASCR